MRSVLLDRRKKHDERHEISLGLTTARHIVGESQRQNPKSVVLDFSIDGVEIALRQSELRHSSLKTIHPDEAVGVLGIMAKGGVRVELAAHPKLDLISGRGTNAESTSIGKEVDVLLDNMKREDYYAILFDLKDNDVQVAARNDWMHAVNLGVYPLEHCLAILREMARRGIPMTATIRPPFDGVRFPA